jgi:hypothetical protein
MIMRAATLLFVVAVAAPPAAMMKPWTPATHGNASMWWWSPDPPDPIEIARYSHGGCWPEYTAWYNKHHCESAGGETKCRD